MKYAFLFPALVLALVGPVATAADAPTAAPAVTAAASDPELDREIEYIEKLINAGYPDFAQPVTEAVKRRWPQAAARLFAIEVRGELALGHFEQAQKLIDALGERESVKYWAARLECANNFFARNRRAECMAIYDEFFSRFKTPPAEIREFYQTASYTYGSLLAEDKRYYEAGDAYARLAQDCPSDLKASVEADAAKMYIRAAETQPAKAGAALDAAAKVVDSLLWKLDQPVFFGMGVSMKAHVEELRGNPLRAQQIIEEYKGQLVELHNQLLAADPTGEQGFANLSPLPECMYLQAKLLWEAAKKEYQKGDKRNDELVKGYLFGEKDKRSGKRDTSRAAFYLAANVFITYSDSPWAAHAGDLYEEIKKFAEQRYNAKINAKITPEQIAKTRQAQFRTARGKFANSQYLEAIADYAAVLARYPELPDSIDAIGDVVISYLDLLVDEQDEEKRFNYRINADAIEGYLAERFSGCRDRAMLIRAGDKLLSLANKERERGDIARSERLTGEFIANYREHPNAARFAAARAGDAMKDGRYAEAARYWQLIETVFTNSDFYATSLIQQSVCAGKRGDAATESEYLARYLKAEKVPLRRLQAQFQLSQMCRNAGVAALTEAADAETAPEAAKAAAELGRQKLVQAIRNFTEFAEAAKAALADPALSDGDRAKYTELREAALYLLADCWGRLDHPAEKLEAFRNKAVATLEGYLADYPQGKYAPAACVKLCTLHTLMGAADKSKADLARLSREYPDSAEAKNAMPRLAKNLIEIGKQEEGTRIYAEMLRTTGTYNAQQFLAAGEALAEAKSWALANQAYEKAIQVAGTNFPVTVAKAQLGLARTSYRQKSYEEARDALEKLLGDPEFSRKPIAADANFLYVEVASELGSRAEDDELRAKYFNSAIGAIKKVRSYWANKEPWEQDQLDLMSADVLVRRMKVEEEKGLKEQAAETRGLAASRYQVFLQAHGVDAAHPIDKFSAGELENLERCYRSMLPLFAAMGPEQADRVLRYGEEYLKYFPDGAAVTEINNYLNNARADLPTAAAPAAAEAATPAAAEAAAETPSTLSQGE